MRKFLNKCKAIFTKAIAKAVAKALATAKVLTRATVLTKTTLVSTRAEGFVDSAVKILISVVIGTLLLGGLYALFNNIVLPDLSDEIIGLFNFSG